MVFTLSNFNTNFAQEIFNYQTSSFSFHSSSNTRTRTIKQPLLFYSIKPLQVVIAYPIQDLPLQF